MKFVRVAGDGTRFRQTFWSPQMVQDDGGVIVATNVSRGATPTGASARITYVGTESLGINASKMTVRVKLLTTATALASNPVLVAKSPSALNDNQWGIALASGGGGRPYIDIANAPADSSQYALATANLLNSTLYVLHWVYDGSLAAASRIAMYANGAVIGQTIGGTIPAAMRASTSPVCLFNRNGGTVAAPPTDVTVYDFRIWDRALSALDVAQDYADTTNRLITP